MDNNNYTPPETELTPPEEREIAGLVPQGVVAQLQETQPWLKIVSILGFVLAVLTMLGGVVGVFTAWKLRALSQQVPDEVSTSQWTTVLLNSLGLVVQGRLLLGMSVLLRRQRAAVDRLAISRALTDLQKSLEHQRKFWRLTAFWGLLVVVVDAFGVWASIAEELRYWNEIHSGAND
jgi:hypothetical protein